MVMNGGGIRDTARVLGVGKNTVISTLKKYSTFEPITFYACYCYPFLSIFSSGYYANQLNRLYVLD
jgi:hypothetical protein